MGRYIDPPGRASRGRAEGCELALQAGFLGALPSDSTKRPFSSMAEHSHGRRATPARIRHGAPRALRASPKSRPLHRKETRAVRGETTRRTEVRRGGATKECDADPPRGDGRDLGLALSVNGSTAGFQPASDGSNPSARSKRPRCFGSMPPRQGGRASSILAGRTVRRAALVSIAVCKTEMGEFDPHARLRLCRRIRRSVYETRLEGSTPSRVAACSRRWMRRHVSEAWDSSSILDGSAAGE